MTDLQRFAARACEPPSREVPLRPYSEDDDDTTDVDATERHTVSVELALMLADAAAIRGDFDVSAGWLQFADRQSRWYKR
jgi:hypothetical protein